MKKVFLLVVVSSLTIFNCANDSEDDLIDSDPLPSTVNYTVHIKPIIDNNCINCHNNPPINGASISLLTYQNVKSAVQNNHLISKINGNGPGELMPLGGQKLPQLTIDLITKWETDGLLEN
ncbi:hypothetical protein [Confluentibacter flavum]|uniref:Cytochrome c domain-containing protein n=1 Tax=Confluentibacter flavum TaxID=1909700 RepID=A0A2N3HN15_9FLAO|nr:hypothetical protein [Confluentibacter flavum]PKQ46341.1 hypothetical protein CSW08_04045 [Confluentibacter flavum]